MQYELYLKYDAQMSIGLNGHWGNLFEHTWANIMHWTKEKQGDEDEDKEEDDEGVDTSIGILNWITYNQALALRHGLNMTNIRAISLLINGHVLFDLDHAHMSQETINEIGAASNPNIVILIHFGISAGWRNKGLGEEVMKGFIEQMIGKCGYVVIIHNEPAQCGTNNKADSLYARNDIALDSLEKDPEKAQYKLNAFWQRCGFKQFKNHENVFICNVDQAVPGHGKMAHAANLLT